MELLFPFVLLIGVMLLMTRSAKNKQRQATQMRDSIEPGTGIRTIGGLYALVKEVREDTVLLEISPGQPAVLAKNAIGAVLEAEEYERIVSGESPYDDEEPPEVPDDASSLTEGERASDDNRVELGKSEAEPEATDASEDDKPKGSSSDGENGSKG